MYLVAMFLQAVLLGARGTPRPKEALWSEGGALFLRGLWVFLDLEVFRRETQ